MCDMLRFAFHSFSTFLERCVCAREKERKNNNNFLFEALFDDYYFLSLSVQHGRY